MDSFDRMFKRHLLSMAIIALSGAIGVITCIVMFLVASNLVGGIITGIIILVVGGLIGFLLALLNMGKFTR